MECCLAQGELIKLDGRKEGVTIRCASGSVWLTKEDGADYMIKAGRRMTLTPGESGLIEALCQSEIIIGSPALAGEMIRPVISLAAC